MATAEEGLACSLHPFHRRLLTEIADGGFGPGDGLIGVGVQGARDHRGRALVELTFDLGLELETGGSVLVVPLCDWGCGAWSCVDVENGHVLTFDESGLIDTNQRLVSWIADWVDGVDLAATMFVHEQRTILNPFTRRPVTITQRGRAIGTPYERR